MYLTTFRTIYERAHFPAYSIQTSIHNNAQVQNKITPSTNNMAGSKGLICRLSDEMRSDTQFTQQVSPKDIMRCTVQLSYYPEVLNYCQVWEKLWANINDLN